MSERLSAYEQQRVAYAQAHLAALAFIDRRLFEPIDLARVAAAAGYSPSEFSRRFARMQGESVMAYVRGRRLETAAARIVAEPGARLLDVAIECGFTSQAAFTRAFTRAFGAAPGRLRRSGDDGAPLLRRRRATPGTRAPVLDERIEQMPALVLVGLSGRFSPANYVDLAALWERLVGLRQAAGGSRRDESFGVFFAREPGGAFELVAASRAWTDAPAPLERVTLPAGRYLVLRHRMHAGSMLPQMNAAQESVRRARHRVGAAWDFERYPANFGEARWIDHYLPLEGRAARPVPVERA